MARQRGAIVKRYNRYSIKYRTPDGKQKFTGTVLARLSVPWNGSGFAYALFGFRIHALHVLVGLLMSLTVQAKVWTGRVTPECHVTPDVFALYWHFVDGVWVFVFPIMFLVPHWVR